MRLLQIVILILFLGQASCENPIHEDSSSSKVTPANPQKPTATRQSKPKLTEDQYTEFGSKFRKIEIETAKHTWLQPGVFEIRKHRFVVEYGLTLDGKYSMFNNGRALDCYPDLIDTCFRGEAILAFEKQNIKKLLDFQNELSKMPPQYIIDYYTSDCVYFPPVRRKGGCFYHSPILNFVYTNINSYIKDFSNLIDSIKITDDYKKLAPSTIAALEQMDKTLAKEWAKYDEFKPNYISVPGLVRQQTNLQALNYIDMVQSKLRLSHKDLDCLKTYIPFSDPDLINDRTSDLYSKSFFLRHGKELPEDLSIIKVEAQKQINDLLQIVDDFIPKTKALINDEHLDELRLHWLLQRPTNLDLAKGVGTDILTELRVIKAYLLFANKMMESESSMIEKLNARIKSEELCYSYN